MDLKLARKVKGVCGKGTRSATVGGAQGAGGLLPFGGYLSQEHIWSGLYPLDYVCFRFCAGCVGVQRRLGVDSREGETWAGGGMRACVCVSVRRRIITTTTTTTTTSFKMMIV